MSYTYKISAWYGSVSTAALEEHSLDNPSKFKNQELDASYGASFEGARAIYNLIQGLLRENTVIDLGIYKNKGNVEFLITVNQEFKSNIPELVLHKCEGLERKKLKSIPGGFIDHARVTNHYPHSLLRAALYWPEGTGVVFRISRDSLEIPTPSLSSLKKITTDAATSANTLNNVSGSISIGGQEHEIGSIKKAWRDLIGSGDMGVKNYQSQIQIQGSFSPLEDLENFCFKVIKPTIDSEFTTARFQIYVVGDERSIIESLTEIASPSGTSFSLNWGEKKKGFDIDFSKFDKYNKASRDSSVNTQQIDLENHKKAIHDLENSLNDLSKITSIDSLSRLFALSPFQFPGINYCWLPNLNMTQLKSDGISLGTTYDRTSPTGDFFLTTSVLAEHVAVLGQTGTGKTNTLKILASNLCENDVKVLIIESSKDEYQNLESKDKFRHIVVGQDYLGLSLLSTFAHQIAGVGHAPLLQKHIGILWNSFQGALPLEGPMLSVLQRCLYLVFERVGWTFDDEKGMYRNQFGIVWPSIQDLLSVLREECQRLNYQGEFRHNLEAALINRLETFSTGLWSRVFNTDEMKGLEDLFEGNTILCLDQIESEDEKSFFIAFIIGRLRQYATDQGWGNSHNQLRYFTIIEEAHRVVPNINENGAKGGGQTHYKEQAVASFNNAIAELRSYGIGVCVADQSPSKISIDVLRNVGTKIIHNIQEKDDQLKAASILGLSDNEAQCLCALPDRGFAMVRSREVLVQKPTLVKVHQYNSGGEPVVIKNPFAKKVRGHKDQEPGEILKVILNLQKNQPSTSSIVKLLPENKVYGWKKALSPVELSSKFKLEKLPFKDCEGCPSPCVIPPLVDHIVNGQVMLMDISKARTADNLRKFADQYCETGATDLKNELYFLSTGLTCLESIEKDLNQSQKTALKNSLEHCWKVHIGVKKTVAPSHLPSPPTTVVHKKEKFPYLHVLSSSVVTIIIVGMTLYYSMKME